MMLRHRVAFFAIGLVAMAGLLWAQGDKPPTQKKNTSPYYNVQFKQAPSDDTSVYYPTDVVVAYETDQDMEQVRVDYTGKAVTSQNAPKTTGEKSFTLSFAGDATGESIYARIHPYNDPVNWQSQDPRYGINFLDPNGMRWQKGDPYKFDALPEGVQLAPKAKQPGDPVPVGLHHGEFPLEANYLFGATARVWIRAKYDRPKPPAVAEPMKTDYDLPAVLIQRQNKGKWQSVWYVIVTEELKAMPRPGGQVPKTLMQAVLLDGKGKVIRLMDYHQER